MRAAVFDFDGVIMDSESVHFRSLQSALSATGVAIDAEEYQNELVAYDDRTSIRIALEKRGRPFDRDEVENLAQKKAVFFDAAKRQIGVFPGVRDLVASFAREMPLAIASGALHREIVSLLDGAELRKHFAFIVAADDVSRTKPHPEPYLRAVELLATRVPGLLASDCVAFEDTVAGIAAARAAGLRVVGITNTYPATKLGQADRVVPSFVGMTPADFRPLFA